MNGSGVENIRLDGHTMLGTAAGDVFDLNGARFFEVNNTATGLELSTGGGNDVVIGSGTTAIQQNGFSTLRIDYDLGAGDDSFTGSGSIQDVVDGGAGDDTLDGGGGDDILQGGTGADFLTGGAGDDLFEFGSSSGLDTISDFLIGSDQIDLTALGTSFAAIQPFLTDDGVDTTVDLDMGAADVDEITLIGVVGLTSSDFLF